MILEQLRESCIGDIMQNEFQSAVCCKEKNDAVEETIISIEEDLKADVKKLEMDEDSSQENNLSSYCKPQLEHAPFPRKDVPAIVLCCVRGSLCKLCRLPFKGLDCLKNLIDHTKEKHSDKASQHFLKKVIEENSYDKMLGDGIMYCTCSMCIRIGMARLDKRYDKARRMCL
ncbi:uncharacterized protein LOC113207705 isoform X2 [Frankliniella occidentalis]|nr:uncharacterized protein LOC113207705 isoform X2 [Frankliniella occidentalis]